MPRTQIPAPAQPEALASTLAAVNKQFGAGALMSLGDSAIGPVMTTPSGSLALDLALGVGGYPVGRIIEIYGPEAGGKTTMSLHAVAEVQKLGGVAVFIDAEHALDPVYAANLGVDTDHLLVSQPGTGEEALEIADMVIKSGQVGIVVVDSVAALVPKAELEGMMGDTHVGLQARLMSQALRKIAGSASSSQTTCIFINQLREKIGVFYGNPETTSGGKALKFYSSVRLDVRRVETIKDGNQSIGNRTRVKVVKNKVSPPFRQAELDIIFGKGISRGGDLIDVGVQLGVVKKSGAWYNFGETSLGQGKDAARTLLDATPDLAAAVEAAIRSV